MSDATFRRIARGPAQRAILAAMLTPEGASSALRHRPSPAAYSAFISRIFAAGYLLWRPIGTTNVGIQPR